MGRKSVLRFQHPSKIQYATTLPISFSLRGPFIFLLRILEGSHSLSQNFVDFPLPITQELMALSSSHPFPISFERFEPFRKDVTWEAWRYLSWYIFGRSLGEPGLVSSTVSPNGPYSFLFGRLYLALMDFGLLFSYYNKVKNKIQLKYFIRSANQASQSASRTQLNSKTARLVLTTH